jgi:hypothetical protein
MESKEKAIELKEKCDGYTCYAEVVVDEIMKAIGWDEMELGVDRDNYWTEVKIEIKKL